MEFVIALFSCSDLKSVNMLVIAAAFIYMFVKYKQSGFVFVCSFFLFPVGKK